MQIAKNQPAQTAWQRRLHTIIFEADTPAGKAFDIVLLISIVASVAVVMLDSVAEIHARFGAQLAALEWGFTILFTVEYGLRLLSLRRPLAYMGTFFGIVDLLAILPSYFSLLVPGTQYLLVVRVLRLLRIFRILKLAEYLHEGQTLGRALLATRRKISVFLLTVVTVVIVVGAVMYVVEGPASGFTSIPTSIYWAVVTLTTVGYGDIAPQTPIGKALAVVVMLLGYGIIAVPTGIVTLEMSRASAPTVNTQACPNCGVGGHDSDARYCKRCGHVLNPSGCRSGQYIAAASTALPMRPSGMGAA
ncbi:ion transporter [Candidatus Gracilibacteria bacterium]|nr:ion transporter [Candidatus Gracilibacteria bacterium]